MAHGTVAFDTLTTSDQVNTGTEKSIDTSYLFNGSAKVWAYFNQASSSTTAADSFNCSGTTDNGTGDYTTAINNDMSDANYSIQLNCLNSSTQNTDCYAQAQAAGTVRNIIRFGDSGSNSDAETYLTVHGDLA